MKVCKKLRNLTLAPLTPVRIGLLFFSSSELLYFILLQDKAIVILIRVQNSELNMLVPLKN